MVEMTKKEIERALFFIEKERISTWKVYLCSSGMQIGT